jgi:hypothetical protein
MNGVKAARVAKGLMKKDLLDACEGILTAHRLNMIEAGQGWRPRQPEKIALGAALGVDVDVLFPK